MVCRSLIEPSFLSSDWVMYKGRPVLPYVQITARVPGEIPALLFCYGFHNLWDIYKKEMKIKEAAWRLFIFSIFSITSDP